MTVHAGNAPLPTPWLARCAAALSASGWACLLIGSTRLSLPALCGDFAAGLPWRESGLAALRLANPPGAAMAAWLAMLLATTPLLLLRPAASLWRRSLRRRRWPMIATFASAYLAAWTTAGLATVALAVALLAGVGAVAAMLLSLAVALAWQASPMRQRAFNRCHRQMSVAAFGWRAYRDAAAFGASHGLWCIATCGPWMLVLLLSGPAHLAAMAAICALLALERDRPARPARWRWPFATLFSRAPQPAHAGLIQPRRRAPR